MTNANRTTSQATRRGTGIAAVAIALAAAIGPALISTPAAATPVVAPAAPTLGGLPYDQPIALGNFTVTLHDLRRERYFLGTRVTVCVAAGGYTSDDPVRVSNDPWTLQTPDGPITSDVNREGMPEGWGWNDTFPEESFLASGQCVTGWITFGVDESVPVETVTYRNSLGEVAVWDNWMNH